MPSIEEMARYQSREHVMANAVWANFEKRIGHFPPDQQSSIYWSFQFATDLHQGQVRASGEPYITHPCTVAMMLVDVGVRDHEVICAALLHDVQEDHGDYKDAAGRNLRSDRLIRRALGNRIAQFVDELTDPPDPPGIPRNKLLADKKNSLMSKEPETIIIRMADRLHNLLTLGAMPPEKQKKKIRETKVAYLPAFKQVALEFPKEAGILLDEILTVLTELETAMPPGDR